MKIFKTEPFSLLFQLTFSLSLLLTPQVFAQTPQESIYISSEDIKTHDSEIREVVVSNSIHDTRVKILYSGKTVKGVYYCGGLKVKKVVLNYNRSRVLEIPKGEDSCILKLEGNLKPIHLRNDDKYSSLYQKYNHYQSPCKLSKEGGVFYSDSYKNMSCIQSLEKIDILSESKDSFLQKLEVLLGYKPSLELIENQNPYAELDFSKAPSLDAIFLSTLLYQNDFSGQLLSRILKFHANRGTLVNIIGTGYMHSENAKQLLKEMSRFSPNIRIQEYEYYESNWAKKLKFLTNYLRDMHVKLLVTLSEKAPENNVVIIGGRNVHDGFLFDKHPDLSKYPELDQVPLNESFPYWQDVEFIMRSRKFAENAYAHLLKLWNRDLESLELSPIADYSKEATPTEEDESKPLYEVRHILSTPFNDDHALEKLFVEMIDGAKESILISSPYLRPTKPIMEAIQRALAKETVEVQIQTRIDLEGDTLDWLYEETNKAAINELYSSTKIYEWKENSILHSKLLVIDNDLSFIGSVNLSRRSFLQDIESGLLVKSESFNQDLRKLIHNYQQKSIKIENEQDRRFFPSILVFLFQNQF